MRAVFHNFQGAIGRALETEVTIDTEDTIELTVGGEKQKYMRVVGEKIIDDKR